MKRKMNFIIKKIVKAGGYVFLFILLLYLIINVFFPQSIIKIFRYQHLIVGSDSMTPVINVHDVIVIRKYNPDKLHKDDIISFYTDINNDGKDEIVTHYFYAREVDDEENVIYRTQSNKSSEPDDWEIAEDDIIGKYTFKIPKIGKIIRFLQHPIGIFVVSLNIIVIFVVVGLIRKNR